MEPIRSSRADDPRVAPLLQRYSESLAATIARIHLARNARDLDGLRILTHQLVGSGASYGFEVITIAARAVEHPLRDGGTLDALSARIDELLDVLQAAMLGARC
ncbi:MAG: Hpt domain-containing protein [Planctomycetes bacterium]|nr:Hpt domain-containing protein [Planctomycetota bacterium]